MPTSVQSQQHLAYIGNPSRDLAFQQSDKLVHLYILPGRSRALNTAKETWTRPTYLGPMKTRVLKANLTSVGVLHFFLDLQHTQY